MHLEQMVLQFTAVVLISVQQDGTDNTFLLAAWAFDGTPSLERPIGN